MRREEYEYRMTNEQIAEAVARLERFSSFLDDASKALKLFAETGREAVMSRKSIQQAKTPLDFAEFLGKLRERHPEAAKALEEAKVLKFELGRMHLRFPDDYKRAAFNGWHKHSVEQLSKDLYQRPTKIMIKASQEISDDL